MKKTEQSCGHLVSATEDKSMAPQNNHGPLVQATISTLFKKAGEKVSLFSPYMNKLLFCSNVI